MAVSNHALTGAIIAAAITNPVIAIASAFISHFLMDALPHYGRHERPEDKLKVKSHWLILRGDSIITIIVLTTIPFILRHKVHPTVCLLAMFAAILPDLIWVYRFIKLRRSKTKTYSKLNKFSLFHLKIQWGEFHKGIYIEAVVFFLMLIIIFNIK